MTKPIVGIDVSKAKLDVNEAGQKAVRQWENDEAGRAELGAELVEQEVELVVVEASGGYEAALVSELIERGVAVAVVNPTRVRAFARAEGQLAKTDQIDARIIARFGATMKPAARARRTADQVELNQAVSRRRQLVEMRTAEKNRLQTAAPVVQEQITRHIEWLQVEIDLLEQQISQAIGANPVWQETADRVDSAPGIGPITAATLVASMIKQLIIK